jgi:hypothetical protein
MAMNRVPNARDTRRLWTPKPFHIVSLDPGGVTGWSEAIWWPEPFTSAPPKLYSLEQIKFNVGGIGPHEHHQELWEFLEKKHRWWEIAEEAPPLVLVCESFEFRQHITSTHAKTKVELISKEYIGLVKLFAAQYPQVELFFQTASAAKTLISDEKIKVLNLWTPGKKDTNDAMRHLLRHMVVTMRMRSPITDRWIESLPYKITRRNR